MSVFGVIRPGETAQAALDRLARDVVRKSAAPLQHHDAISEVFRTHRELYDAYQAEMTGQPLPTAPLPRHQDVVHVLPGESAVHVIKRCLGAAPTPEEITRFFSQNPRLFAQYGREMAGGDRE